jgi:type IV secretory pathway VirB10-like protein
MSAPTPENPPVADPQPAPPAPTPPPNDPKPPADPAPETDWKAEARKWEKRAKENAGAAEELEKHKAAAMSDAEKAVAAAKAEGRTEALKESGAKLARAEFKAAVAAAGVDLGEALDLIDTSVFVTDKGDVDEDAIKKAVAKFAKLAPKPGAGRSGGDLPGGPGNAPTRPKSLHAAVDKALGGQ